MDKKQLRQIIRERKKECPLQERLRRSCGIITALTNSDDYARARNILCYWSLPDEVDTHDFVVRAAEEKRIFLPVVDGDNLRIREFTGVSSLTEGESYSIPEPSTGSREVSLDEIDLVIVPGMAFDRNGGRMGRGKGFYDRLLGGSSVRKVGICFSFQLVDEVPREAHDILMDRVISEEDGAAL